MTTHTAALVAVLPPGTSQLTTIIAWVTGLVGVALFVGFLIAMGKTGLGALRHGHWEGGSAAAICLVCAVFLGAATAIFGALGVTAS